MLVSNNIDFLLVREDLLQVFTELVPQLNNNKDKAKITYNIIENINKNNFILILDNISLVKIIKEKFILNNWSYHLFSLLHICRFII